MIDGLEENIKQKKKESKFNICKYFKLLHSNKERSEGQHNNRKTLLNHLS